MVELLASVTAWLMTYVAHSTLLLGAAFVLARFVGERNGRLVEGAWRVAMCGAIATALTQATLATSVVGVIQLVPTAAALLPGTSESITAGGFFASRETLLAAIAVTWLLIATSRVWSLLIVHRRLLFQLRDRAVVVDARLLARVRVLAPSREVVVTHSANAISPLVIGRREIVLPSRALAEMSGDEIDAVLAHEIAHIARRDMLWLGVTAFMEHIFFIQPLNRVAQRQLRSAAERACDDWAVMATRDKVSLASALARVTGWHEVQAGPPLVVAMASHESMSVRRVRRILDPGVLRIARPHRAVLALGATAAMSAVVLTVPRVTTAHVRSLTGAPAIPHTITAEDDAGPFTLTVDRGHAIAMTINGGAVSPSRLHQTGSDLLVDNEIGEAILAVHLTKDGGLRWTSRKAQ